RWLRWPPFPVSGHELGAAHRVGSGARFCAWICGGRTRSRGSLSIMCDGWSSDAVQYAVVLSSLHPVGYNFYQKLDVTFGGFCAVEFYPDVGGPVFAIGL